MKQTFHAKRQSLHQAFDRADDAISAALALLDDLPCTASNEKHVRELLGSHQAFREMLRSALRRAEKL